MFKTPDCLKSPILCGKHVFSIVFLSLILHIFFGCLYIQERLLHNLEVMEVRNVVKSTEGSGGKISHASPFSPMLDNEHILF